MSECYFLTATELDEYIEAGYTLVSGPHSSEEECLVSCGSGSGSGGEGSGSGSGPEEGLVPCCPDALPTTLYATIVGTDDCTCLDGTYELTWNEGLSWVSETLPSGCTGDITVAITCDEGSELFDLTIVCNEVPLATGATEPNTMACDPVDIQYLGLSFDTGGCCESTFNVFISETV